MRVEDIEVARERVRERKTRRETERGEITRKEILIVYTSVCVASVMLNTAVPRAVHRRIVIVGYLLVRVNDKK